MCAVREQNNNQSPSNNDDDDTQRNSLLISTALGRAQLLSEYDTYLPTNENNNSTQYFLSELIRKSTGNN